MLLMWSVLGSLALAQECELDDRIVTYEIYALANDRGHEVLVEGTLTLDLMVEKESYWYNDLNWELTMTHDLYDTPFIIKSGEGYDENDWGQVRINNHGVIQYAENGDETETLVGAYTFIFREDFAEDEGGGGIWIEIGFHDEPFGDEVTGDEVLCEMVGPNFARTGTNDIEHIESLTLGGSISGTPLLSPSLSLIEAAIGPYTPADDPDEGDPDDIDTGSDSTDTDDASDTGTDNEDNDESGGCSSLPGKGLAGVWVAGLLALSLRRRSHT